MNSKKEFVELKPGMKLLKSTTEVEACAAPTCGASCNELGDCMTNGYSDCLAYPDPDAVIRVYEGSIPPVNPPFKLEIN